MRTKIIYVLTSNEQDIYLEQTYLSVYSLRMHEKDAHVVLLTDNKTNETLTGSRAKILQLITEKVVVDFEEGYSNMKRSRFLKTSMRNLIDGDFLYIDGDTLINDTLAEIDDCPFDIGAVEDAHRPLEIHYGKEKLTRQAAELGFDFGQEKYYFNGGVFYVKDNTRTKEFFKLWHENWKCSVEKGINLDMPALIKTNIALGHVIQKIDGCWNCQLMYGFNYYASAKIIHYFASRYTHKNGGYIYDFMNPAILDSIKSTGEVSDALKKKLQHPLSCFSNNLELIGGADVEILNAHVYKMIRMMYNKTPKLFAFFQSILFAINRVYKRNNE